MDDQQNQNRRQYFRVTVGEDTLFHLNINRHISSWGRCILLDVSAGGAQIVTPLHFPVNDLGVFATLQFRLNNSSFSLDGDIVWCKKSNKIFKYGLKWRGIDQVFQEELLQRLMELQSKKVHVNVR